jgi:photosystem II stability/assembly factor-like uncharacterized protein
MFNRVRIFWIVSVIAMAALSNAASAQDVTLDSDTLSGLPIRAIGPAAMGGRIADIAAVHEGQRLTIYIGSASGGVWKSVDSGITFKPIFDKQPSLSIGSIAVDPSNPQNVWVGTGESWVRNSVSVGTGVYRTPQRRRRLGGSRTSRLRARQPYFVDPKDGNTVYACALGHLWNSNTERGVFKTTDGGKNWTKLLYRNDSTGCAEMAMDPKDSSVLYAAMWDVRREPHNFRSGGPGSGLFKSTTRARPGTNYEKACRQATWAGSAWPSRLPSTLAFMRWSRPRITPRFSALMMRARVGPKSTIHLMSAEGPSTLRAWRLILRMRIGCTSRDFS